MEITNWIRDLLKVSINFWESFLLYGTWDRSDWDDTADSNDKGTNIKQTLSVRLGKLSLRDAIDGKSLFSEL